MLSGVSSMELVDSGGSCGRHLMLQESNIMMSPEGKHLQRAYDVMMCAGSAAAKADDMLRLSYVDELMADALAGKLRPDAMAS